MKNKVLKILLFLATFVVCIFMIYHCAYAASGSGLVATFPGKSNGKVSSLAQKTIGPVLSAIRIVAIGISVIMITYLGIKYVSSAPAEKASIKNQLIALVVGVALIAVATKVIEIMQNFSSNLFPG